MQFVNNNESKASMLSTFLRIAACILKQEQLLFLEH